MAHRTPAALLLAVFLAAAPAAQTDAEPDVPVIGPGARALLFQAGPDLTLGPFGGSTISIKRHQTETRARRLGLTVALSAEAGGGDFDTGGNDVDTSENSQFVGLGLNLLSLRYRRSRTPVYLYRGFGPSGSLTVQRREFDVEEEFGPRDQVSAFYRAELGVTGVVGVEWVVTGPLSVLGEYATSLEGTYTRRTSTSGDRGQTTNQFGVAVQPRARFGVSVYF
jgi:hypothetical protein